MILNWRTPELDGILNRSQARQQDDEEMRRRAEEQRRLAQEHALQEAQQNRQERNMQAADQTAGFGYVPTIPGPNLSDTPGYVKPQVTEADIQANARARAQATVDQFEGGGIIDNAVSSVTKPLIKAVGDAVSVAKLPGMTPVNTFSRPGQVNDTTLPQGQPAFESYVPHQVTDQVRKIPVFGQPAADVIDQTTSPAGIVMAAAAPVETTAKVLAGSAVAGSAGEALDQVGAPRILPVSYRTAGELAGGVVGPAVADRIGATIGRGVDRSLTMDAGTLSGAPYTKDEFASVAPQMAGGSADPVPVEPSWNAANADDPAEKLRRILVPTERAQFDYNLAKSKALGTASGDLADVFAGGGGADMLPDALGKLKGWAPEATAFKPPIEELHPTDVADLYSRIAQSDLRPLEKVSAMRGLDKTVNMGKLDDVGRVIRPTPSERKLLDKVFPGMEAATEARTGIIRELPANILQESYPPKLPPVAKYAPKPIDSGEFPQGDLFDKGIGALRQGKDVPLEQSYPAEIPPGTPAKAPGQGDFPPSSQFEKAYVTDPAKAARRAADRQLSADYPREITGVQAADDAQRAAAATEKATFADPFGIEKSLASIENRNVPAQTRTLAEDGLHAMLNQGEQPTRQQLDALRRVFGAQGEKGDGWVQTMLMAKRSLKGKAYNELVSFLGLPQTLKSMWDFGTRLRQSAVLGWSHPSQWLSNWKPTVNAMFSEEAAQATMTKLKENPWYSIKEGEQAGLGFDDLGGHVYDYSAAARGTERAAGFAEQPNSAISRITRKVPFLKGSERSMAVDLNKAGVEVYAQEAQAMWNSGERNPEMYRKAVEAINHARGYGAGGAGNIAQGINAFFSPRNLVAKFQVVLDPILMPGSLLKPSARQLAAKNLVGMVAGDLSLVGLIGAGGALTGAASVQFNPLSPGADWLKVRVGGTRIDPWGGFQPLARLMVRMAAAASTETRIHDTGWSLADAKQELGTFFANKEAPIVRMLSDAVGATKTIGGKRNILSAKTLADLYAPFITQDVWDAVKDGGLLRGAIVAPLSTIGIGTSTYTSPTEQLQQAWKDKHGTDWNPETDYTKAAADPDLKPLVDAVHQAALDKGTASAQTVDDNAAFFAQKEQELRIPELAKGVLAGDSTSGTAFVKAYSDFQSAVGNTFERQYLGSDPKVYETPAGKAYQAWQQVTAGDDKYWDAGTASIQWDAYFTDKKAAFDSLKAADPELASAIEAKTRLTDPDAIQAEQQLKEARALLDAMPPKYAGLTQAIQDRSRAFAAEITQKRPALEAQLHDTLTDKDVAGILVATHAASANDQAAWEATSQTDVSPAYLTYLVRHKSVLEPLFPNLYQRKDVREIMAAQPSEAVTATP